MRNVSLKTQNEVLECLLFLLTQMSHRSKQRLFNQVKMSLLFRINAIISYALALLDAEAI